MNISVVKVEHTATNVQFIYNGELVFDKSWRDAQEIAQGIMRQCRKCEELEKANEVIEDQSILDRSGLHRLGISNNPNILLAAKKEALYNPRLRRYLPNKEVGQTIVGTPGVKHG